MLVYGFKCEVVVIHLFFCVRGEKIVRGERQVGKEAVHWLNQRPAIADRFSPTITITVLFKNTNDVPPRVLASAVAHQFIHDKTLDTWSFQNFSSSHSSSSSAIYSRYLKISVQFIVIRMDPINFYKDLHGITSSVEALCDAVFLQKAIERGIDPRPIMAQLLGVEHAHLITTYCVRKKVEEWVKSKFPVLTGARQQVYALVQQMLCDCVHSHGNEITHAYRCVESMLKPANCKMYFFACGHEGMCKKVQQKTNIFGIRFEGDNLVAIPPAEEQLSKLAHAKAVDKFIMDPIKFYKDILGITRFVCVLCDPGFLKTAIREGINPLSLMPQLFGVDIVYLKTTYCVLKNVEKWVVNQGPNLTGEWKPVYAFVQRMRCICEHSHGNELRHAEHCVRRTLKSDQCRSYFFACAGKNMPRMALEETNTCVVMFVGKELVVKPHSEEELMMRSACSKRGKKWGWTN